MLHHLEVFMGQSRDETPEEKQFSKLINQLKSKPPDFESIFKEKWINPFSPDFEEMSEKLVTYLLEKQSIVTIKDCITAMKTYADSFNSKPGLKASDEYARLDALRFVFEEDAKPRKDAKNVELAAAKEAKKAAEQEAAAKLALEKKAVETAKEKAAQAKTIADAAHEIKNPKSPEEQKAKLDAFNTQWKSDSLLASLTEGLDESHLFEATPTTPLKPKEETSSVKAPETQQRTAENPRLEAMSGRLTNQIANLKDKKGMEDLKKAQYVVEQYKQGKIDGQTFTSKLKEIEDTAIDKTYHNSSNPWYRQLQGKFINWGLTNAITSTTIRTLTAVRHEAENYVKQEALSLSSASEKTEESAHAPSTTRRKSR